MVSRLTDSPSEPTLVPVGKDPCIWITGSVEKILFANIMNDKVFISSTVYDLLDIRDELEQSIRGAGLVPILSDSATSDFTVAPDANSIETCLTNVRASDYVMVVLSQRYGPSLLKVGYPDLSATHLEYQEAVKHGKPVYFYVRDKLESDYRLWRNNGMNSSLKYSWVKPSDSPIFDFLHTHQELVANKPSSNWYSVFRTSVDLKRLVQHDLHLPAGRASFAKAIANNNVPVFQGISNVEVTAAKLKFTCEFTNYGNSPAFNVTTKWRKGDAETNNELTPIVAPQHSFSRVILSANPITTIDDVLDITCCTADGHIIIDEFDVSLRARGFTHIFHKLTHKNRRYIVGTSIPFTIEDHNT